MASIFKVFSFIASRIFCFNIIFLELTSSLINIYTTNAHVFNNIEIKFYKTCFKSHPIFARIVKLFGKILIILQKGINCFIIEY